MDNQRGMTVIGMLFSAIVVIMAAVVVMKIIPVYLQNYSIVQSVKSLSETDPSLLTGDQLADAATLRKSLTKRLDINGIQDLKENEVVITPKADNSYTVTLKYQVVRELVYNMSLLFDFNDTEEVRVGSKN